MPTAGLVDDQDIRLADPMKVAGTKTYSTVVGSSKTILLLEPYDSREADRIVAARRGKRKPISRTFTDKTGKFKVVAEYFGYVDGKVKLRKSDGKTLSVPLSKFSDADRRWVAEQFRKDPTVTKSDHTAPASAVSKPSPTSPESEQTDAQARSRWINTSYGSTIYRVNGKQWAVADKSGKVVGRLRETAATPERIEFYHEARKQNVRIDAKRMEFEQDGKWHWLSNGHWDATSKSKPLATNTTNSDLSKARPASGKSAAVATKTAQRKWYQGGTLHRKSILDWQVADDADKLATCGDFVTKMWQDDKLTERIARSVASVDDIRPYAQELVDFIDAAGKRDPDPEQNKVLYANQSVSEFAVIGMVSMKWLKAEPDKASGQSGPYQFNGGLIETELD